MLDLEKYGIPCEPSCGWGPVELDHKVELMRDAKNETAMRKAIELGAEQAAKDSFQRDRKKKWWHRAPELDRGESEAWRHLYTGSVLWFLKNVNTNQNDPSTGTQPV